MQYVLTKDKRLLIAPDLTSTGGRVLMSDPPMYEVVDALGRHFAIVTGEVAKQADTIEELCDEFVVWSEGVGSPISTPLSEKDRFETAKAVMTLGLYAKANCWLRLAIWTDKGLDYVAELVAMEKGGKAKWELL